jgi:predicted aldo/keto reductase-like oxidoreductase
MTTLSSYLMNDTAKIPSLGLGVYLADSKQTVDAVKCALESGYRLIDTASAYGNEAAVGEGIRQSDVVRPYHSALASFIAIPLIMLFEWKRSNNMEITS